VKVISWYQLPFSLEFKHEAGKVLKYSDRYATLVSLFQEVTKEQYLVFIQALTEYFSEIIARLSHLQLVFQQYSDEQIESALLKGLSIATIKNRNAHLRWACEVLGKMDMVPSNDALGIGKRCYSGNNINKAVDLDKVDLSRITNRNVLVQIHLQRYLGLRREESIKFKPWQADKGDWVILQPSWCKGRRGREISISTPEARYWLEEAKKLVANKDQSLIVAGKNYIQHRHLYDNQTRRAGIKHPHGLRHAYAQDRYNALTGWECPKRKGLTYKQLTAEQKAIDDIARTVLTEELGHYRKTILTIYCGK
jgi:hypothetical protein